MFFKNILKFITFADYPRQIKFIMWNEATERYAFYGMRAILVIYMSQYLRITENIANAMYSYFNAFAYLTPILGAYLADRYLGKFKAILIFSIIYAFGFLFLAFSSGITGLIISLFIIGLGTGGIKPCISTFMAEQLDSKDHNYETTRAKAFGMFYFMINLGSILSTFLTPITRDFFGPKVAFSIPAILMILSLMVFLMGRKYYIVNKVAPKEDRTNTLKIIFLAIKHFKNRDKSGNFLSGALKKYSQKEVSETYNLFQLLKIFVFMIIFYAVWDQQGSSWVTQALTMDKNFFGITIPTDIMQFFNPLFILILIPVFNKCIYPFVEKFVKLTPFRKAGAGIISAGIAFITLGVIQQFLDSGVKVHILWQVLSYFIITVSEVFLIVTIMEFSYSQAPKSMRSTIMSLFWLTVFLGDLLAAVMFQLNVFSGAASFYFFAALAIVMGILFIPVSKTYKHINID